MSILSGPTFVAIPRRTHSCDAIASEVLQQRGHTALDVGQCTASHRLRVSSETGTDIRRYCQNNLQMSVGSSQSLNHQIKQRLYLSIYR